MDYKLDNSPILCYYFYMNYLDKEDEELLGEVEVIAPQPHKLIPRKTQGQKSIHHDKRQKRRKQTAEDFTPPKLVNEMLDKLPKEVWTDNKTFLDPAAGNGNMLIEVLKRKLSHNHDPLQALSTLYGTDIMADNIREARIRLIKVIRDHVKSNHLPAPDRIKLIKILWKNLICTPLRKYKNGSLDYDFNFNHTVSDHTANKIFKMISKQKLLDQVVI